VALCFFLISSDVFARLLPVLYVLTAKRIRESLYFPFCEQKRFPQLVQRYLWLVVLTNLRFPLFTMFLEPQCPHFTSIPIMNWGELVYQSLGSVNHQRLKPFFLCVQMRISQA
jgi:hypothetical protein